MSHRIVVITAGHLSTCPRMLKAADALHGAGYDVRVVSANFAPWAAATDRVVRATRRWRSTVVDYARQSAPVAATLTSLRWRAAAGVARATRPASAPWQAVTRAYSRAHSELVTAALAEPAEFFYGGTTGGLAATAEAARRAGRPYAVDLEDWHTAESVAADAPLQHALAARIEARILAAAAFRTAGSTAIAQAYQSRYSARTIPIHNVFDLPARGPAVHASGDRLRACWFGQTLGPDRGLEEAVDLLAASGAPIDFDLRGHDPHRFVDRLRARHVHADLRVTTWPPAPPDALVEWCAGFHVGVSVEPQIVENRRLCLSNKLCTYLLAGLAVVANHTPGQQAIARDAGEGVAWYPPDDRATASAAIARWARDRAALARSREASWRAAVARWHWGHRLERGALLEHVARALS